MRIRKGSGQRTKKIRLLLIEDNRLLREGLTALLATRPDVALVGASSNFDDSIVRSAKPQLILLDHCLRSQNPLRVLRSVKKNLPAAKVIVMGLLPLQADVAEFVKAGASAFLLKDSSLTDFLEIISAVARGERVLPPQLTNSLFSSIVEEARRNGKVNVTDFRATKRQRDIIDLIGAGLSNKEIAQKLHLATHTVKSHVHAILEKLALHSRVQVAIYAHDDATSKNT